MSRYLGNVGDLRVVSQFELRIWAKKAEAGAAMDGEEAAKAKALAWVSVLDQLSANPLAVVECPFCRSAPISVQEVPYGLMPGMPIAHVLSCGHCHEHTTSIPYTPRPNDPNSS